MRRKNVILIMLAYWGICFAMFQQLNGYFYLMLAWNVLLAVLPLFFISMTQTQQVGKLAGIAWTLLWLFFFPNSVYMVTDFIHIAGDKFKLVVQGQAYATGITIAYSNDVMVWLKLMVIGFGVMFSLLVGLESLYLFEQQVKRKFGSILQQLCIFGAILLSGIGVYVGRFLRFNSWDVVADPIRLLRQTYTQINGFSVQFIGIFTVYVAGCYVLYKALKGASNNKE